MLNLFGEEQPIPLTGRKLKYKLRREKRNRELGKYFKDKTRYSVHKREDGSVVVQAIDGNTHEPVYMVYTPDSWERHQQYNLRYLH